ncbi:HNH endonuclease, partial [bacterium]|nr:HNH endonuclease [bacterium]
NNWEKIVNYSFSTLKFNKYNKKISPYPYQMRYNKVYTIFDYLYNTNNLCEEERIIFNNDNRFDLTTKNVKTVHFYHKKMITKYPNAIYIKGHKLGKKENSIMKNPMWKVGYIIYVYCIHDKLFTIDEKSLEIIQQFEEENNTKLTFCIHTNGYVQCNPIKLYIHQIIMNCFFNGKGTKIISVDHIDQNKTNNTYSNLRIATRKEQENNSKGIKEGTKRARKSNARPLPPGLTHEMLPKYIVYYKECYNKEKDLWREFLKIEKHPKSSKSVCSSKSTKLTILQKLEEIKLKIHNIENDIVKEKKIPKYHTIQNYRNAPHLVYDRRIDKLRINLRMKLNPDVDIEEELLRFQDKLKIKHPDYIES